MRVDGEKKWRILKRTKEINLAERNSMYLIIPMRRRSFQKNRDVKG